MSVNPPVSEVDKLSKLSWSGVVRVLALALPHAKRLVFAAVLSVVSSGVSLAFPLLARRAIDRVLESHDPAVLNSYVGIFAALIGVSWVLMYGQFVLVAYVGNRIVNDLRLKVFGHLVHLPVRFYDKTRSGDLTSRLTNDISQVQGVLTDDLVRLGGNVLFVLGGLAEVLIIDWRLTIVVFGLLVAVMCFFVIVGRRLRRLTRASLDALASATGAMSETLASIRLVKAFAREDYESQKAKAQLDEVLALNMRSSVWEGMMGAVASVGFLLVLLGVLWYGGHSVLAGRSSAGDLAAFTVTFMIVSGPMGALASLYTRLQRAIGACDRIFGILDEPVEQLAKTETKGFPKGGGRVLFEGVSFSYTSSVPVLNDLSLELAPGEMTAVVGKSGAGKSTVASLLYRFYEVEAGMISVDGVLITSMDRNELRSHIALVPQEPVLFNGTIMENIRYGRLDATEAEIRRAADLANVTEFVDSLPDGLSTVVGERGITLSGGQRQRVAIARAVLKNPSILVLDEATSALDTRSELLVQEALDRLMKGRTTLVIAHRLSTVRNADRIVVLDEGQVCEQGTHEELLALRGKYAGLHDLLGPSS